MVGASRFELPTSPTPRECATVLRHAPNLTPGLIPSLMWSAALWTLIERPQVHNTNFARNTKSRPLDIAAYSNSRRASCVSLLISARIVRARASTIKDLRS